MPYSSPLRPKIWIVDDSPTDSERVRRIFASDYEVETVSDGSVALERLSTGSVPDLLLLDWVMPGVSGIEVCKFLRASSGALKELPVILLTAQYGPQEIYQAFTSGANDYVSKPFVEEELKARVAALLESKRLRKRAERAEGDLRALLENAPDPMFAFGADGKISFVNEEGVKILSCSRDRIIGIPFANLISGISDRHLLGQNSDAPTAIPDVQINQAIFSPSVRVSATDLGVTTTVTLRDVTARRNADSRRLDFYSVIAHDLRTPITSILLRLEVAFRGKHGALPEGHVGDLKKTRESLRGLVGLINDFLELAKLEGVGYRIVQKSVNLCDLVNQIVEDFLPLLEKGNLRFAHSGPSTPVILMADRQRLSQVISNLLGNAIKFTEANGKVETEIEVSGGFVEFSVRDSGVGIQQEDLAKLFQRYTRASDVPAKTSGTGLGLMIVREIIEAHGGSVGAESKVGEGSRFWFKLPLTNKSAELSSALND